MRRRHGCVKVRRKAGGLVAKHGCRHHGCYFNHTGVPPAIRAHDSTMFLVQHGVLDLRPRGSPLALPSTRQANSAVLAASNDIRPEY
jgi:hypothetical protein